MYISKLTLTGFKSFLRKTKIVFDKGVTCIVGPNGCGKTNIVDAIRWVIGEQKTSILRANRNVDVIFNGSEKRRPANFAEVSLTIHNVSGKMPIDYTDVVITRRVFRNSDSEYLINKTPCRLKDITDLFIDTGMGANAYSVIELSMVEDILSETPQERRELFEEAAGINKYHRQRKSALRKLDSTKEDLVRVEDIIGEVKSKVNSLKRQLRRYKRYQKTSEKLVEAEVVLASREVFDLQQEAQPLKKELNNKEEKIDSINNEIEQLEQSLKSRREKFQKIEQKLDNEKNKLEEIKNKKNQFESDTRVLKEKRNNINSDITRLENEIAELKNNITSAKTREAESKQEADKFEVQLERKNQEYKKVSKELDAIDKEHTKVQKEVNKLQDQRYEIVTEISEITANQNNLKSNIEEREQELKEIQAKLTEGNSKLKDLKEKLLKIDTDIQDRQHNISELEQELTGEKEKKQRIIDKESKLLEDKRELDSKLDRLNNKIDFYTQLIENREGFKPAVKFILDNTDQFRSVKGALSDLIYADKEYYKAIETYISELSELIVTKDRESGLKIINRLKELGKGQLTIVPMDINIDHKPKKNVSTSRAEPLAPHIQCGAEIEKIKNTIFSDVYICEDEYFDELVKTGEFDNQVLVTKKGRISNNGFLTGSDDQSETLLVGRQDKLTEFEQKYDRHKFEQEDVVAELDSIAERKKQLKEKIKGIEDKISHNENNISELKKAKDRLDKKMYRLETDLENWNDQKVNLKVALENFRNKLESDTPGLENLQKKKDELDQKIDKIKTELQKKENSLNQKNQAMQNARVERVDLKNKLRNVVENKKAAQKSIHKFKHKIKNNEKEINNKNDRKQDLAQKIQSNTLQLDQINKKVDKYTTRVERINEEYRKTREKIQSINEDILKLRQNKEYLSDDVRKLELKISEFQANQKEIKTVLAKKYERSIKKSLVEEDLPEKEKAEKKVNRLKKRLENIGTVNMEVKDQYEEEAERLEFLEEQRDDLQESQESLNEIIDEIDEVAREKFMTTFEQIKKNFQSIFNIFFQGGEADLKLLDDDPLDSKIEIFARPGGKKLRSIRMLSAGEKTLTAIALIFGIYQVKPSPFCILDEVDAPLDDPNTRRFLEMIDSFSDNTQFIIVTHNKITMSAADNLYGVTMSEKGVSQIVSARMEKELENFI